MGVPVAVSLDAELRSILLRSRTVFFSHVKKSRGRISTAFYVDLPPTFMRGDWRAVLCGTFFEHREELASLLLLF